MIVLYCSMAEHVRWLAEKLATVARVTACQDWLRFEDLVADAVCGVIVCPWLNSTSVQRLRQLRARHPYNSLILVTTKDFANARHLSGVTVDEVLWLGEEGPTLIGAAQHAVCGTYGVYRLGILFEAEKRLPLQLRQGLSQACHSKVPVLTVRALADRVGCSPSTLSRQWRRAARQRLQLRLKDVIDWLFLLRALAKKRSGWSWERVADDVGLYRTSLSRMAARTTGCSLGALAEKGILAALQQFQSAVYDPLLPS